MLLSFFKKRKVIWTLFCLLLLFSHISKAQINSCGKKDVDSPADTRNVIQDPDFDRGNFSSFKHDNSYIEGFRNNRNYSEPGELFVTDNTRKLNNVFPSYAGYGGSGNFLAIDGSSKLPNMFWGQTMTFTQNKWYYFEIYVMTIYDNTPGDTSDLANFQFKINDGLNIFNFAREFKTPNLPGIWTLYTDSVFYTGPTGLLDLQIWNTSGGNFTSGNDFAIDRLYLREGCDLAGVTVTTPQPKLQKEIALCNGVGSVSLSDFGINCNQSNLSVLWSNGDTQCTTQVKQGEDLFLCIQTLGSCIKSDQTLVFQDYSIELGPNKTLCKPFTSTLSTQISGNTTNRTIGYKWFKDGNEIIGSNLSNLSINSAGTYVLEASDNICHPKRDTIIVTGIEPAVVSIIFPTANDTLFTTKTSIIGIEMTQSGSAYDQAWSKISGQGVLSDPTKKTTNFSSLSNNEPEFPSGLGTSRIVASSQDLGKICPIARDTLVIVKKPISIPLLRDTSLCSSENLPFTLIGNEPISKRFETNRLIDEDNLLGLGNSHSVVGKELSITNSNLAGDFIVAYEFYNSIADSTSKTSATITIVAPPSIANAGLDQEICADSTILNANTPLTGTGNWVCNAGILKNSDSPNAILRGLAENENSICIWTIKNRICKNSTDTVKVKRLLTTKWQKNLNGLPRLLCPNEPFNLDVLAVGEEISYQWFKNNSPLTGQINSFFEISSISPSDSGEYHVEASGKCGTIISEKVKLNIGRQTVIIQEPQEISVCKKETASLMLEAEGENLSYQWYHNKQLIKDSIGTSISFLSTVLGDSGEYQAIVKGRCGADTTLTRFLIITDTKFPTVLIAADREIICKGENINFTAHTSTGGKNPSFTFKNQKEGTVLQSGSDSIFAISSLDSSITVLVEMTSDAYCIDPIAKNPAKDSIYIRVVLPASVSIFSPSIEEVIYTTENTMNDLEMSTMGKEYDNQWTKLSGQGNLTNPQDTKTDLTNLINTEPEINTGVGTSLLSASSQDLGKYCPKAMDSLAIIKKSITSPIIHDAILCASTDLPFSVIGNEPTSKIFETNTIIDIDNLLGLGNNFSSSGNQIDITNTLLEGDFDVRYEIFNIINKKTLFDNARIKIYQDPSSPDAGEDLETCLKSVQLSGNTPGIGSGKWSCDIGELSNPNLPNATLKGLSGSAVATCIWTTSNGNCPDKKDTVQIRKVADMTIPNIFIADTLVSGKTLKICITEIPKLSGASPKTAEGESAFWTTQGSSIADVSGSNPNYGNLVLNSSGKSKITWTIESTIHGCETVSSDVILNVFGEPIPNILTPDTLICETESINILAENLGLDSNKTIFQWYRNNLPFGEIMIDTILPIVTANLSGVYTVKANNFVCSEVSSATKMNLDIKQVPKVNASYNGINPIVVQEGSYLNLSGYHTGQEAYWSSIPYNGEIFPMSNLQDVQNPNTGVMTNKFGKYKLVLTSIDKPCSFSDTVFLQIRSPIRAPNVFSANGDGTNETFKIKGLESYDYSLVSIYNRWGTLVYQSLRYYQEEWDGADFPDGVYFYTIETDPDRKVKGLSGCIHLVR